MENFAQIPDIVNHTIANDNYALGYGFDKELF